MRELSIDAIIANPWNAVRLPLPVTYDQNFLQLAFLAAEYCAAREQALRHWLWDDAGSRKHQQWQERWQKADAAVREIAYRLVLAQQSEGFFWSSVG